MIRVVLDSNVLVSGSVATRGAVAIVLTSWTRRDFEVIMSSAMLEEYERTLDEPYFAGKLTPSELEAYVAGVRDRAAIVDPSPVVRRIATHPEDDLILATAVAGAVDYLVTGDRQLLALGSHEGIPIINPADFVTLLDLQP